MEKKKLVIVSHYFFPDNEIGGRRWSNLVHYLKNYFEIVVITTENKKKLKYYKKYKGLNVIFYRSFYPKVLGLSRLSFLQKVKYHLAKYYIQLGLKKSPYDKTILDEKTITNCIVNEIEKSIEKPLIIATGAPFSLLKYATLAAKKYNIPIWIDLRDPWTWANTYGMSILPKAIKEKEVETEKWVLENASVISVPVMPMYQHLENTYKGIFQKLTILPHGFNEYPLLENKVNSNRRLKLIYGGTVYKSSFSALRKFIEIIEQEDRVDSFEVYALNYEQLKNEINISSYKLKIYRPIENFELIQKIKDSDFYLAFYPDEYKDFISTKFYEIIYTKTPIILFSNYGVLSNFIEEKKVGVTFRDVSKFKVETINNFYYSNNISWLSDYSFSKLALSIQKKIENI